MKKHIKILAIMILTIIIYTTVIYARAGGGSSGGGGGGGSSGGGSSHTSTSHHTTSNKRTKSNPIASLISYLLVLFLMSFSAILFRIKLLKAKRHSKQLMNLLDNRDDTWKYDTIQKQVKAAYFAIQKAWTKQDMSIAKDFMEEDLYENFRMKLEWMQIRNQRNILKKISLLEAIPVSVYDDKDDTKDYIWYLIKGSMIDYIIDINTNQIVEGKNRKDKFIEYWKFVRQEEGKWILAQILQEDEKDKIIFQGEK